MDTQEALANVEQTRKLLYRSHLLDYGRIVREWRTGLIDQAEAERQFAATESRYSACLAPLSDVAAAIRDAQRRHP